MPPRAKEMQPVQIKGLEHPGGDRAVKVAVGGVSGLYIQIQPSGAKSWVLRTRYGEWVERKDADGNVIERGRKKREIGLGPYPDVLPGAARDKAREFKAMLEEGIDPIAKRKEARAALAAAARRGLTFREALDRYATEKVKEFSSEKYRVQWRATIDLHAIPEIGDMLVQDIALQDVLRVLQPIWTEKTVTAAKLRQRIEKVLAYATVQGHRTGDNPARWTGNLDMVLPAPSKVSGSKNWPALQLDDAVRWWDDLRQREGMGARALEFQALTASRSGAIRFAAWDEIDFNNRVWTIQPGRKASKIPSNGKAHRVPLTDGMVALLESLPRLKGCPYVFWAPKGGALSDATLGKVAKVIHESDIKKGGKGYLDAVTKEPMVPHGLRSTFRTWVAERTRFDGDMAEIALAHKVGTKVQQAYDRSDQIEKRRRMMAAWHDFLSGKTHGQIVELGAVG
ncbi:integrase arm-type DNA-binding domain-containing protein [Defluviimonas sp. WL0050]|uniref:Integrase arm-type DNA-binding domain-containing protein n=1 Tax=Albidovulum litorale TaxID=2984134 RepID=A0ABT2ZN87_9RHOB|nr:site-specific integrase [Defluviimonas sp. WL0050]MCV2872591.1 integrase arm-type DNA-binding domain-containing protein [Defluviimonas sp. WL0050]